ncbi:MAG: right-handed parallel beta-helix repeat-containing protein [Alphaproteobacteria bacterium]|nr:right-handed parallel beta-helix repeat-containing protein [Alphaproteobacteria bacterium]
MARVIMGVAAALVCGLALGQAAPAQAAASETLRGYSIKTPERYRVPPDSLPAGSGSSKRLCVDPSKPANPKAGRYATIAEAVAKASRDDIITIEIGAVAENLVLNKPLTLRGGSCEDGGLVNWPTEDKAPSQYSFTSDLVRPAILSRVDAPCLTIDTDGIVFLHGLRFSTEGAGGAAQSCIVQRRGWMRITDSIISAGRAPAAIEATGGNTRIEGNMILGGRAGITLGHAASMVTEPVLIENSTITRGGVGIQAGTSTDVSVTRNVITGMLRGGVEQTSGTMTLFGNYLSDNRGFGLSVAGGTATAIYNTISGNRVGVEGSGGAFKNNLIACNREGAGVPADASNQVLYNPIPQTGWFSKKPDPEATAFCRDLQREYRGSLGALAAGG